MKLHNLTIRKWQLTVWQFLAWIMECKTRRFTRIDLTFNKWILHANESVLFNANKTCKCFSNTSSRRSLPHQFKPIENYAYILFWSAERKKKTTTTTTATLTSRNSNFAPFTYNHKKNYTQIEITWDCPFISAATFLKLVLVGWFIFFRLLTVSWPIKTGNLVQTKIIFKHRFLQQWRWTLVTKSIYFIALFRLLSD